jgi:uracil-DNA glycosylase family 4
MSLPPDVADHLKFFETLGVRGASRDPAWRERAAVGAETATVDPAPSGDAASTMPMTPPPTTATAASMPGSAGDALDLAALRAYIGHDCTRCKLHTLGRTQVVFGAGNPEARLMFVGEAPGADEDVQGEPFVGRAGQLLTKIIESIGLQRSDVYIANVIKCRPPGNRNPEPDEVSECQPFLFRQIDLIKPRVIVALGTFAAHALLGGETPISKLRGVVQPFRHGASLIPTFHPAYLLRSPERKRDVWEDMKKVRELLGAD